LPRELHNLLANQIISINPAFPSAPASPLWAVPTSNAHKQKRHFSCKKVKKSIPTGRITTRSWYRLIFQQIFEVNRVSVNYAFRFSGPVTALTARRVRYGVGPDLICQLSPSPGIKTHPSPAAFPTTLSLSFCLLPSYTAPSCLRLHRALLTPLLGP
jgi:hypothetical protein